MIKESTLLGIAGIILGIAIIIKQNSVFVALIPMLIGIALIIFSKEESKIEKRKDLK
jgi:uncharacterized membrane protein HdeD (DUF308 family)